MGIRHALRQLTQARRQVQQQHEAGDAGLRFQAHEHVAIQQLFAAAAAGSSTETTRCTEASLAGSLAAKQEEPELCRTYCVVYRLVLCFFAYVLVPSFAYCTNAKCWLVRRLANPLDQQTFRCCHKVCFAMSNRVACSSCQIQHWYLYVHVLRLLRLPSGMLFVVVHCCHVHCC